jgi:hypothetical protein
MTNSNGNATSGAETPAPPPPSAELTDFVVISVSLPYSKVSEGRRACGDFVRGRTVFLQLIARQDEFNADLRSKFRRAIAAAAGVPTTKVEIVSISERSGRRLLATSIEIKVKIRAKNEAAAATIQKLLTAENIDR